MREMRLCNVYKCGQQAARRYTYLLSNGEAGETLMCRGHIERTEQLLARITARWSAEEIRALLEEKP